MATASAPASSANLGPGFDVLALALEMRCHVTATPSERWSVRHTGPEHPGGHFDLVMAAAQKAIGMANPLEVVVDNRIPIGKGLGSSAAASTAGAVAAWRAMGESVGPERLFKLVAGIEEHPDNAAAAVYGGLVLCPPDGKVRQLTLHPSLIPLVAVPADSLPRRKPGVPSTARSLVRWRCVHSVGWERSLSVCLPATTTSWPAPRVMNFMRRLETGFALWSGNVWRSREPRAHLT